MAENQLEQFMSGEIGVPSPNHILHPSLESDMDFMHKKIMNEKFVPDSQDDAILKLAKELNVKLDDSTKDYLWQYYLDEKSNETAWKRTMESDNTQYQRAVEDLRKAGLNPFLAIQGLTGATSSFNGMGTTGGLMTSSSNSKRQTATATATGIFAMLAMLASAVIKAL